VNPDSSGPRASALPWPPETGAPAPEGEPRFAQVASNFVLDFHGDPAQARLAVFSDGNHYMALEEALRAFSDATPESGEPFYTTTPPRVISELLASGALRIGNLRLSVRPHVFISPPAVLERLRAAGHVGVHAPLARNRGIVLLVRKGNPRGVRGLRELVRPDVRLFFSNPVTEKVSFDAYFETAKRVAAREGVPLDFVDGHGGLRPVPRLVFGEVIHHREAPLAVSAGAADVALVFHHLGLRCQRAFPDRFDLVALGHETEHVRSETHIAPVGDGGAFGAAFVAFMRGAQAARIYERHGLDPLGFEGRKTEAP
jgi:hypothetical protein